MFSRAIPLGSRQMNREGQVDMDAVTTFFDNGREMCALRKTSWRRERAVSIKEGRCDDREKTYGEICLIDVRRWP